MIVCLLDFLLKCKHGNILQYSHLENPHGQGSLVGCSPWGHRKSDTTERLSTHSWFTLQVHTKVTLYICVCMCVCVLQILFHHRLLQDTEYYSLCYTVCSCCLSILYIAVCIHPKFPIYPSPHLSPFGDHKFIFYV